MTCQREKGRADGGRDKVFLVNGHWRQGAKGKENLPPSCLTNEEEFVASKLRQEPNRERKFALGDFMSGNLTEEEEYHHWGELSNQ
jgi:hypothetical protein